MWRHVVVEQCGAFLSGAGRFDLIQLKKVRGETFRAHIFQRLAWTSMQWNVDFIPREWRVISKRARTG